MTGNYILPGDDFDEDNCVLTDLEMQKIILSVIITSPDLANEEDLSKVLDWAVKAKVGHILLDMLLMGLITIAAVDQDGPRFEIDDTKLLLVRDAMERLSDDI